MTSSRINSFQHMTCIKTIRINTHVQDFIIIIACGAISFLYMSLNCCCCYNVWLLYHVDKLFVVLICFLVYLPAVSNCRYNNLGFDVDMFLFMNGIIKYVFQQRAAKPEFLFIGEGGDPFIEHDTPPPPPKKRVTTRRFLPVIMIS